MTNILNSIGNTPLVKMEKFDSGPEVNIFAKLEGLNPTGSIKDRIALAMIEQAEKEGRLVKGKTILEPTSGNTGIALAMVAAVKGYKMKIVMPESMSIERRKILKVFGVEIILVKREDWRDAAIRFTKGLAEKDDNLVMLNQYENKMNKDIHYQTTAQEIIEQMEGKKVDYFIAGIGTGGTISGIGRRLKEEYPDIKVIGVEPEIETQIQGLKSLAEGYIPPILDLDIIDEKIIVQDEDAFESTRALAREEGIFAGISSGAAYSTAKQIAGKISSGNIVTIYPDRGERYLSTKVFE
ncbi:cysteine synthase family protein [Candidatus Parcubacteria bacterium]|nr:cysteine synthase family protein [Candidatus Parcubacteria bacterium]